MRNCGTCEFCKRGICHRFPMLVTKYVDDWCGEYRVRPTPAGDPGEASAEGAAKEMQA